MAEEKLWPAHIAKRIDNAEDSFIESIMERGFSRDEARKAMRVMLKLKVAKLDPVGGRITVKHGAFLEPYAIRNALNYQTRKRNPRGKRRPVSGCYAVGKARIRRRKVNPGKRRPVSGCYAVGKARIRRRKVNPGKRRAVSGCYAVGKARIRRRKVNPATEHNAPFPRRPPVVLYAQRPGGPRLKYLSRGKFGTKGAPRLFRGAPEAMLAAWILKDTFPDVLRPYRMFAQ